MQATFAVGIVTAVLGLVATVYISDENRRKVAGVIWLVVLLPLTGFAYNYNMLAVSLKSGAVPSHMTLADLIAEDETVGGLNVQRIASSSVAELIHISEDIGALSHLVHLMLAKAANGGRRQKANMAHGLKGIFGDFAPASLVHNSLLVPPRKAAEGERGGGERGEGNVGGDMSFEEGTLLGKLLVRNRWTETVSVNPDRDDAIPMHDIMRGALQRWDARGASAAEAALLLVFFQELEQQDKAHFIPSLDLGPTKGKGESSGEGKGREGEGEGASGVTLDSQALLRSTQDSHLDLSEAGLATPDLILISFFLKRNTSVRSLDLSGSHNDGGIDSDGLHVLASIIEESKATGIRTIDLMGVRSVVSRRTAAGRGTPSAAGSIGKDKGADRSGGRRGRRGSGGAGGGDGGLDGGGRSEGEPAMTRDLTGLQHLGEASLAEHAKLARIRLDECVFDVEGARGALNVFKTGGGLSPDEKIGNATAVFLSAMLTKLSFDELDLSGNHLTDLACQSLASKALSCSSKESPCILKSLDLSDNFVGDVGVIALSQALQENVFLVKLDLSRNRFTGLSFSYLGATLAREGVSDACMNLCELHLDENKISLDALKKLFSALSLRKASGTQLRVLTLSGVMLFSTGAKHAADMLRINTSLEVLVLSDCRLCDREAAPQGTTSGMGKKVGEGVGEGMGRGVRGARGAAGTRGGAGGHDSSGIKAIARALASNPRLQVLDLGRNALSTSDLVDLLSACRDNPHTALQDLMLGDNNIGVSMTTVKVRLFLDSAGWVGLGWGGWAATKDDDDDDDDACAVVPLPSFPPLHSLGGCSRQTH